MKLGNLARNEYSSVPYSLGAALLRIIKNWKIWREGTRPENLLPCTYCCSLFSEEANPALPPPQILSRGTYWHGVAPSSDF